ncbi:MAG TPA: hypothetical protein VHH73_20475, partial [Verrucomicrobiae bacterium]|nr:hypothetical protein [Verrucomicrobiae bacterium]
MGLFFLLLWGGAELASAAEVTNVIVPVLPAPTSAPAPESLTWSIFRVFGALMVVLGVFFGFVWLFRNWQRVLIKQGRAPRLNVLEMRSLGSRHSIYVVG